MCAESDWHRYRPRTALLTGAPSFTASPIAPGDPLAVAVPVNDNTMTVVVGIRLEDDPDTGRWPSIVLNAKTNGDETVQLPLEDTVLPPDTYFASPISLVGEFYLESDSEYISSRGGVPYILSWWAHFELPQRSCQTDILSPTFEVLGD